MYMYVAPCCCNVICIYSIQVRRLQKLGDKAFKKKDYAKASDCYKEALEIDAENVQLLSKRAVSNIELKDYPEARVDADVLVKLNPHVPQVLKERKYITHTDYLPKMIIRLSASITFEIVN